MFTGGLDIMNMRLDPFFTDLGCTVQYVKVEGQNHDWRYFIKHKTLGIDAHFLYEDEVDRKFWADAIKKLIAILANGTPFDPRKKYNQQSIKEFIDEFYFKKTPEEKLNTVIEEINKLSTYEGELVDFKGPSLLQCYVLYFNNQREWTFYRETAVEEGYLRKRGDPIKHGLTKAGLSKLIKINEGKNSLYCFVAMAFSSEMNEIFQKAIEPAVRFCGYEPYRVDHVDLASDQTINDGILAGIKKSKFTIADFTYHKNGVYFEGGFALGRGQKVIYTCRTDHMDSSHFDTRNYQHIIWHDANDLKNKLINKIQAFIDD